jgi:acetylornithine deacetylase/succinyl-diaminopimelate desuccinylase-like protein
MRIARELRTRCLVAALTIVACISIPRSFAHAAGDTQVVKAPNPRDIDYDKLTQEATDFLSKYIRINTSNPPGNELETAKFLKEKFLSEGIPANTWEPEPGRGIVAARLRGIGEKKKALILQVHMDVVPANVSEWKIPPFSGEVKDGAIWGRGAADDKGPGVIAMMAMFAIKRAGILLDRDIIFIATGDEEVGGRIGAQWFTEHEKDIYADAGYVMNMDSGGIIDLPDGKKFYSVDVTEKTPLWLRLTTTGKEGHASAPPAQTAVTSLIGALARIIDYHPQIRVLNPVQDQFRAIGELEKGPKQFFDLANSLHDATYAHEFLADPSHNAAVRDTIAPTVLAAGFKTNVLPPTATAEIDCRLLPGENQKQFLANIDKLINDRDVKVEVILQSPSASSPVKSALMSAIERLAREDGHTPVIPAMSGGFTDTRFFRAQNLVAYSFTGMEFNPSKPSGVHGIDEHIEIKPMGQAIQRIVKLLEIFAKEK